MVALVSQTPSKASGHNSARIVAVMMVAGWIDQHIAHVAAAGWSPVVDCRIVGTSKSISSAPGHAVAWKDMALVVTVARVDVGSRGVRICVAETHLGRDGESLTWVEEEDSETEARQVGRKERVSSSRRGESE